MSPNARLLALMSVIFSSVTMAETEKTSSNADIESLEVTGRKQNLIGQSVSASEGVVGQQDIDIRPLMRTGEILELVPGMVVTQHSGNGKANQYFLRGINLDHGTDFSTSFDGMPLNMRTHAHGQGYTDLNFIIPETIERLNYKKGAYYAEVGDFSGAGSAQMHTANTLEQGIAEFSIGDHGFYRTVLVDSQTRDNQSLSYAAEYAQFDGPWENTSEELDRKNLWVKYLKQNSDYDFSLSLMAYQSGWNGADQIPQRAVESGLITELDTIDTSVGGESSRYSVNADWSSKHWTNQVYVIHYDLNLWSNFTYFLDDPVNGDQFEQHDKRTIYGSNHEYRFKHVSFNNTEHKLGAQLRIDDIAEAGLYKTQNRQRIGSAGGAINVDSVMESSLGVYWNAKTQWTKPFSTSIGFRTDAYHFDVDNQIDTNVHGFDISRNGGTASDNISSLKLSGIYNHSNAWESYLSWGNGFHSNDARGVTIAIDPSSGEAIDNVDPLVRSTSYEYGLRFRPNKRLNASIAIWALEVDSELLFVGDAGSTEASGASERVGVEFTSYYRPTDAITIDLEYAYTDAQYSQFSAEGNFVPGAIREVLQTGISAKLKNHWSGSLRARYFGPRPLNESGSVKSDSSTIVNAKLVYSRELWDIKLQILNLLNSNDHDIDYLYTSRLRNETAGGEEDIHYHVLEHRSARFAISRSF